MAENAVETASAPAASGAITKEQVQAQIDAAVDAALGKAAEKFSAQVAQAVADATKPLADKLAAVEANKGISADDVAKAVEAKLGESKASAEADAAKKAFIGDKLKGVPETYVSKLGNDPAKWAEEEQAIRTQLKSDLAAIGATVPNVSGGGDGAAPAAAAAAAMRPGLGDGVGKYAAELKVGA